MSTVTIKRSDDETKAVHGWTGTINPLMPDSMPYQRIGDDVTNVNMLGRRAPVSNCTAVYLVPIGTDISTLQEWFAELKNDFLTLTFPFDTTAVYALCHDIRMRVIRGKHNYSGTSYDYRIELSLALEGQ